MKQTKKHRNKTTILSITVLKKIIIFNLFLLFYFILLLFISYMCMCTAPVWAGSCRGQSHGPWDTGSVRPLTLTLGNEFWSSGMSCNCRPISFASSLLMFDKGVRALEQQEYFQSMVLDANCYGLNVTFRIHGWKPNPHVPARKGYSWLGI